MAKGGSILSPSLRLSSGAYGCARDVHNCGASVHNEDRAGHVGRLVTRQIRAETGDLRRFRNAAERHVLRKIVKDTLHVGGKLFREVAHGPLYHLGPHRAGTDDIAPHLRRAEVEGHLLREPDKAAL